MAQIEDGGVAAKSGTFPIGGDLEVRRLGFGAMQLTGRGVWASPRISMSAAASCGGQWSSAST